jgi:hypothetical protein
MSPIEVLHQRLLVISSLLDTAAAEVRDIPLSPVKENFHHIGKALAEIYDLLRSIYAVRPDLVPEELGERKSDSEANKRLTPVLSKVHDLLKLGNIADSIDLLQQYIDTESSELHKTIAIDEIEYLQENRKDIKDETEGNK